MSNSRYALFLFACILTVLFFVGTASAQSIQYGDGWKKECFDDGRCAYSNALTHKLYNGTYSPTHIGNISYNATTGDYDIIFDAGKIRLKSWTGGIPIDYIVNPDTGQPVSMYSGWYAENYRPQGGGSWVTITPLTHSITNDSQNKTAIRRMGLLDGGKLNVTYRIVDGKLKFDVERTAGTYGRQERVVYGVDIINGMGKLDNASNRFNPELQNMTMLWDYRDITPARFNYTFNETTNQTEGDGRWLGGHNTSQFISQGGTRYNLVVTLNGSTVMGSGVKDSFDPSWTVGESGNAWTGNSTKTNTTLNRDTNRIMLQQVVNDYISYWRFDGSSGTVAYDENATANNNGTVNGATWNSSGKFGNALSFDGVDDSVIVPDSTVFPSNIMTIIFTIIPNSNIADEDPIIYKKLLWNNANGWYFEYEDTVDVWRFVGSYSEYHDFTNVSVPKDIQQSFAWVINGKSFSLYKNGIFGQSITFNNPITSGTQPIKLGTDGLFTVYTSMILDNVMIFNRALTNDEINQTMNMTMFSQGNLTTWYNAGTGWQGGQVKATFTNDTNSFVDIYASADNITYNLIHENVTNNTYYNIPEGSKNQTQYVRAVLKGNSTSTPELVSMTVMSEYTGNTIYIGTMKNMTEVSAYVNNVSLLQNQGGGVWLLNANLVNNNTANTFYINETDVTWLKINSTNTSGTPTYWYYLTSGKTEINNTKITSWNITSNTVESLPVSTWARSAVYASGASSKMNISNSNMSYLGYNTANMYGVYYTGSSHNQIINNSFLQNYFGIYLDSSSNNTLASNTGTSNTGYGIRLFSSSNNNNLTNNTGTSNTNIGIFLYSLSNNILALNIGTSNTNIGIYLEASSNNNFTSNIFNTNSTTATIEDIFVKTSSRNNTFINTNFTKPRKIEFYTALTSEFNQSQNSGVSFVSTNVSIARTTNRSIINWNQTNITWTETFTGTSTGYYTASGLIPSTTYQIYNDTVMDYQLSTDNNGLLPTITMNFTTSTKTIMIVQASEGGTLYERNASQAITLSNSVNRVYAANRNAEQAVLMTENIIRTYYANRQIQQSLTMVNTVQRTLSANRAVSQALTLADTVASTYIYIGTLYIRYVAQAISLAESIITEQITSVNYIVSGYVTNNIGYIVPHARVEYSGIGGSNYTFSDDAGHYILNVSNGQRTFLAQAIGYLNQTNTSMISGGTEIDFQLSERKPVTVSAPGFSGIFTLITVLILFFMNRRI